MSNNHQYGKMYPKYVTELRSDEDLFGSEALIRPDSKGKLPADIYYKLPNDHGVAASNSYRHRYSSSLDHDKFLAAITKQSQQDLSLGGLGDGVNPHGHGVNPAALSLQPTNAHGNNKTKAQAQLRVWHQENAKQMAMQGLEPGHPNGQIPMSTAQQTIAQQNQTIAQMQEKIAQEELEGQINANLASAAAGNSAASQASKADKAIKSVKIAKQQAKYDFTRQNSSISLQTAQKLGEAYNRPGLIPGSMREQGLKGYLNESTPNLGPIPHIPVSHHNHNHKGSTFSLNNRNKKQMPVFTAPMQLPEGVVQGLFPVVQQRGMAVSSPNWLTYGQGGLGYLSKSTGRMNGHQFSLASAYGQAPLNKKKTHGGPGTNAFTKPYRQLILMNLMPELQNLTALANLFKPYGKVYSIKLMESSDFSTISVAWKQHLGLQLATAGHGAIVEFETARAAKFCCGVLRKRVYEQNFRVAVIKPGAEQELEQQYSILHAARNGYQVAGSPNGSDNGQNEEVDAEQQHQHQHQQAAQAAQYAAFAQQQQQKIYAAAENGQIQQQNVYLSQQNVNGTTMNPSTSTNLTKSPSTKRFLREKKSTRNIGDQNTSSESNSEKQDMYLAHQARSQRRSLYGLSTNAQSHGNIPMSASSRQQMREELQALQDGLANLKRREKNASNAASASNAENGINVGQTDPFNFEQQFKYINHTSSKSAMKDYQNAMLAGKKGLSDNGKQVDTTNRNEHTGSPSLGQNPNQTGEQSTTNANPSNKIYEAPNSKDLKRDGSGSLVVGSKSSGVSMMPARSKSNLGEKGSGKAKNAVVIDPNSESDERTSPKGEGKGWESVGYFWGRYFSGQKTFFFFLSIQKSRKI